MQSGAISVGLPADELCLRERGGKEIGDWEVAVAAVVKDVHSFAEIRYAFSGDWPLEVHADDEVE